MLPAHGKIECRSCFTATSSKIMTPHPDWRMINDPGAWGSSEPEYLVLGFSKGATQAGFYDDGRFEDVAFKGMRPRLTKVLRAMGVLSESETVDRRIADPESSVAFGSLVRCSVSRRDEKASLKKGSPVFACTGPLISKSFAEIPHVIRTCATRYLASLPSSVRVVFFLGNTDSYVKSCQSLLRELFPSGFAAFNEMAVRADGRLWVHLAHPSGLNGHFDAWLNTASGPGAKRVEAANAVAGA